MAVGLDLDSAEALAAVRDEAFQKAGPEAARGILYALGLSQGWVDGHRVRLGFEGSAPPEPRHAGPLLPILFCPDSSDLSARFTGTLSLSPEASHQIERQDRSPRPMCLVSAGYAAGWFSALLGDTLLVRETQCRAQGEERCRFEARRLEDWQNPPCPDIEELRPFLDLEAIASSARAAAEDQEEHEGPMLGRFDPLSPAAHIWGPVMILPYSGAEDSEDALLSVERDLAGEQVRVVIVDLTGARIDTLEAAGLARVLDCAVAMGLEAILVGLDREDLLPFQGPEGALAMPLCARDIFEGIVLGFQMCQGSAVH